MPFFNLKTKFLFIFIILSVIPMIIVTIISYHSYTDLVAKQVSLIASNILSSSVERINNVVQDINRITETLVYQQYLSQNNNTSVAQTVATELNKYSVNPGQWDQYDLFVSRRNMRFVCENLMYNYSYINGVYIFTPSGYSFSYGKVTDLQLDYKPFGDAWYQKTIAANGELYIGDVGTKNFIINAKPSIAFSRALFATDSNRFLGVLMLDCSLNIFKGLDKDILPNISNIFIINHDGKILFDNTRRSIGRRLPQHILARVGGKSEGSVTNRRNGQLIIFKSFPRLNWKVVAVISVRELNKQFGATQKLIIYIALTCAAIFTILSLILSTLLTKPIIELSQIMRKNKSHQLVTTKKQLERSDEIGVLYTEYNNMITEINTFIKESYQNKIITLDAQMKALEAQINSHFLYNTLESINSIAEIEEVESIAVMSKALGDMFRYSIKTKSELVSIHDELTHVHNYLAIQKIRYADKIHFTLNIQEDLLDTKILKLILQPMIENAIYHGLENKKDQGEIVIKGYCKDAKIYFEVRDDGVGMSPDQVGELQKILDEPPQFTELGQRNKRSIGIQNVHSRIGLYYGPGYGLTLKSNRGVGTEVMICVPRIGLEGE